MLVTCFQCLNDERIIRVQYNSVSETHYLPVLFYLMSTMDDNVFYGAPFDLKLVHRSHITRKKFTDSKSLGIIFPYLVRQPVITPLIPILST